MPWCPKCRNEYREGFTVCADCGVELVDKLGEAEVEKTSILNGPIAEVEKLLEFLNANNIKGVSMEETGDGLADLMVDKKNRKAATFAVKTYFEKRREEMEEYAEKQKAIIHEKFGDDEDEEDEDDEEDGISLDLDSDDTDDEDDDDDEDEKEEKKKNAASFRSSKEKADDAKNSAIALILMGVLGLTFEGLVVFHALPLRINGTSGKVLYAFMAVVFVVLLVFGIMSIFTAKRYRASIVDESDLKAEILKFCKEEAVETANKLIPSSPDGEDESVYFARMDFLKSAVKREPRFQDVDDSTIDGLLDENYKELFG